MSENKAAVRYFTRTGHTKAVAEAMASAAGCEAKAVPAPLDGRADVLFLGCSVYGGCADASVAEYVGTLDAGSVGRVALFSTSGTGVDVCPKVRTLLEGRGIPVADETFLCAGAFGKLNPGRPDEGDLAAAGAFAEKILNGED